MALKRYAIVITGEILIWQNAGEPNSTGDERARELTAYLHDEKLAEMENWVPHSGRHFVKFLDEPTTEELVAWGIIDEE